jgi:chromosome segregation and condensation protein ScpB
MMRTRVGFSEVIRTAADLGDQGMEFTPYEMAVLATIAYRQGLVAGIEFSSERALPKTDFKRCVQNWGDQVRSSG